VRGSLASTLRLEQTAASNRSICMITTRTETARYSEITRPRPPPPRLARTHSSGSGCLSTHSTRHGGGAGPSARHGDSTRAGDGPSGNRPGLPSGFGRASQGTQADRTAWVGSDAKAPQQGAVSFRLHPWTGRQSGPLARRAACDRSWEMPPPPSFPPPAVDGRGVTPRLCKGGSGAAARPAIPSRSGVGPDRGIRVGAQRPTVRRLARLARARWHSPPRATRQHAGPAQQ
jgi:hypothetical protein